MKQNLTVEISENKAYNIEITDESFAKLNQSLKELTRGKKRLVVISKKVYKLYNEYLDLSEEELFIIKDGEKEKNLDNYIKIMRKALALGLSRKDVIVAIGGGVVGDITGFVASTYMRGIDYIQIPTTLLSAVDSSVGGKTAVDFDGMKNVVGAFYQPKAVLININFLKTLDKSQFMSGLGEVLKYALIECSCAGDYQLFLFEFLTLAYEKILDREALTLIRMIEYCLKLKISVVKQDEKENDLRRILNLGHTFGHALESITKFKKYTHGEAVIYGIYFILEWAKENKYISYSYYRLSKELLDKFGFTPIKKQYPKEAIINAMLKDKKANKEKVCFVVPCDKKEVKIVELSLEEVNDMFS